MPAPLRTLVLCTANQCRSPMAAALLSRLLPYAVITSAGSLASGRPASDGAVRMMATRGIDLRDRRSRVVGPADLHDADLVIGMARSHVREAVVTVPPRSARCSP